MRDKKSLDKSPELNERFFLPNFCGIRPLFILIIGAELLAIVLILATGDAIAESWDELGLISIFVQWIALASAGVLCAFRKQLAKLPIVWSATAAYFLVMVVIAIISGGAQYCLISISYQPGDSPEAANEFMFRCMVISAIITLVALRYFYVQQQWKERIQLESDARVQALQARIRPHFLFNSMNIIASLIATNPDLAEQAVEDLSELFRATLRSTQSFVPLKEEKLLSEHYLRIEGLRLGNRLTVNWDLGDVPMDAAVPMLTFQPLMENAIYHGIQPLPEGGTIDVTGILDGNHLEIKIVNPIPVQTVEKKQKGHQIALGNIRHRLNLLFGGNAKLSAEAVGEQYRVVLRVPYINAEEANATD